MDSQRPTFTVKVADTPDDVEACYAVRVEVFVTEQRFPLDTELDEYDPTAIHFLVLASSPTDPKTPPKAVGTVRLVPHLAKLTRLAVLAPYRKFGLGRVLVQAFEDYVANNADLPSLAPHVRVLPDGNRHIHIKINSQMPVVPFYAKFGYVPEGDIFDEEGEPHQKMVRDIPVQA